MLEINKQSGDSLYAIEINQIVEAINNKPDNNDLENSIQVVTDYVDEQVNNIDLSSYEKLDNRNQPEGYAGLDNAAKLSTSLFPDEILGNVRFKGLFDGSIVTSDDEEFNGNPLPSAVNCIGVYFISSQGFTINSIEFSIGDWIISTGNQGWQKVDNSDAVTTVFGRMGNIVANESDYAQYYAPIANSFNYIQNQTGTTQNASFNLSGTGKINKLQVDTAPLNANDIVRKLELDNKQDLIASTGYQYFNGTSLVGVNGGLNDLLLGNGSFTSINPRIRSTTFTTITPTNLPINAGNTIQEFADRTQGQINSINTTLSKSFSFSSSSTVPTPTSVGVRGEVRYNDNYKYECIATNTWIRIAINTSF